jgi:CheY-like chemotaxis protein
MLKPKVLIVEDDALLRELSIDMVQGCDCDPITADDADQAIALLLSDPEIALVLTDINMPGSMDGLGLAHAVRQGWPPLKIIIVSGRRHPAPQELPEGASFLGKPYRLADMQDEISRLVAA